MVEFGGVFRLVEESSELILPALEEFGDIWSGVEFMWVEAVSPVDKDEAEGGGVGVAVLWHDRGKRERCKGDNRFVGKAVV